MPYADPTSTAARESADARRRRHRAAVLSDPHRCNGCSTQKDPDDGFKLCASCRSKRAEYHQQKKNDPAYRERRRRNLKAMWERDHERMLADQRRRYAADPEKFKAAVADYRQRKPDLRREHARNQNARRRARVAGGVFDLTREQWEQIVDDYDGRCAYCGDYATQIEHVVPIAKGGGHTASNVVPACGPCNSSKGAKDLLDWLGL